MAEALLAVSLTLSIVDLARYPRNLIDAAEHVDDLASLSVRLDKERDNLFRGTDGFSVHFLHSEAPLQPFERHHADSENSMHQHLQSGIHEAKADPQCRFVFLHAKSAIDPLYISERMFKELLTYHQVSPKFLNFCFTFGYREKSDDFIQASFRHTLRLEHWQRGPNLPVRGRTGKDLQICYNLRSVEVPRYKSSTPWSIRQTAIYHSLDLESWRSVWIVLKGNLDVKKRFEAATEQKGAMSWDCGSPSTRIAGKALTMALAAHLEVFRFCAEGWPWYVSWLEQRCRSRTQSTLLVDATKTREPPPQDQDATVELADPPVPSQSLKRQTTMKSIIKRVTRYRDVVQAEKMTGGSRPIPEFDDVSFEDLQEVQYIEEKIKEALLVIDLNLEILRQLETLYRDLVSSPSLAAETCESGLDMVVQRFCRVLGDIAGDFQLQRKRLATLSELITERKVLLNRLVDFQNMKTNRNFAEAAHNATDRMEALSVEMGGVAKRTERDTIAMRIVTVLTAFFLPGTFVSTLFSTNIVSFSDGTPGPVHEVYSPKALYYWLAVTLPLMLLTFCVGLYYFFRERRPDQAPYNNV